MGTPIQGVIKSLQPWRDLHKKTAFRPITREQHEANQRTYFGGTPLLPQGEEWPKCGRCGRKLHLFLQLDLADLPITNLPWHDGLMQVFYCINADFEGGDMCDDYEPFSVCHRLRVIPKGNLFPATDATGLPDAVFPTLDIIEWQAFDDYPDAAEHRRLGLRYDYDYQSENIKTEVHWDAGEVHFHGLEEDDVTDGIAETIASAASKDKLLGWPDWVQGVEYPCCPTCQQEMEYLFQIDSKDHVPHMFGDVGCGHVTFCRQHPEQIAFTWACS